MASNKHAIIRYRTIDTCLRDIDRQWTWKELANACRTAIFQSTGREVNVSERTIKHDLSVMRSDEILSYHAPIEYDRKEKTYYYSDPRYTLTESPINKTDTAQLQNAISLIEQFMEVREATGIQNILTKLESSLDRQRQRNEPIIQFDHDVDAPGQQWLYQLYQFIKQKEAANISYQPFGKPVLDRIISPQLLKEYKGRWYLLSYDHKREDSRLYALDRVKGIRSSLATYITIDKEESKKYFDQVVGVTVLKDKEAQKVTFEVYGIMVNYFKTKPLHQSQRLIEENDERSVFEIQVIANYELISELMSYHTNIKVLSPASLISEMSQITKRLSSLYK